MWVSRVNTASWIRRASARISSSPGAAGSSSTAPQPESARATATEASGKRQFFKDMEPPDLRSGKGCAMGCAGAGEPAMVPAAPSRRGPGSATGRPLPRALKVVAGWSARTRRSPSEPGAPAAVAVCCFRHLSDFGTAESVRLGPSAEVGGGGSGGDAKNGRDMKFTGFMAGNSLPGMPGQREVERSEGAERRAIIRRKRGLKVDALAPSRNLLFSTPMDTLRRWAGLCRAPPRSGRFRGTLRVGNRSCRKSPRILS